MELKRAYGVLAAVGTKLGERARTEPDVLDKLRAPQDADAFRIVVRLLAEGRLPDALVTQFVEEVVTDAEWEKWRARLLVQVKMTREGGRPKPGHEAGRGVGRP